MIKIKSWGIHFNLRQQGDRDPIIQLWVFDSRFPKRKFSYSTKISIPERSWDEQTERAHNTSIDLVDLNNYLERLRIRVIDYLTLKHDHKTLDRASLRRHINDWRKDGIKEATERKIYL